MRGMLKHKPASTQFLLLIAMVLVGAFFGMFLLGTSVMSAFTGVTTKDLLQPDKLDLTSPQMIDFMRGMQFFQFLFVFVFPCLLCARFFSDNSKKYLGLVRPTHQLYLGAGVAILLLAIPLCSYLGELNRHIQFPAGIEKWARDHEESAAKQMAAFMSHQTIKDLVVNLVSIALLAAIGEELLFRGMVQRLLIKWFRNPWAGIIVSAILFSAFHFQFYGFVPRLVLGILLGVVYWYSGSLWVAILAHFVYDALLIVMVYMNPGLMNEDTVVKAPNIALMGAVSFALVVLLVIWMKKRSAVTFEKVYAMDGPVKNHPFDFDHNTPV